ncbi:ABC transporter ATP-binding protein, partial [Streptomyces sp. NPDC059173]
MTSSTETAGTARAAGATLAELERRAAARRDRPSYGHDALIACDRVVRIFTTDGVEVQAL